MLIPPTVVIPTPATLVELWEAADARGRAVLTCARAAFEATRAYRAAIGESERPPWELQSADVVRGYCRGVEAALAGVSPAEQHSRWCSDKLAQGWSYGVLGSDERKETPNLVPYFDLPEQQRAKDQIFGAVVVAVATATKLLPLERHTTEEQALDGIRS